MPHSLKQDGLLEAEAIAAMSEAFEAACKQLDDTGQPEWCLKSSLNEFSRRRERVSVTRFACGQPRFSD